MYAVPRMECRTGTDALNRGPKGVERYVLAQLLQALRRIWAEAGVAVTLTPGTGLFILLTICTGRSWSLQVESCYTVPLVCISSVLGRFSQGLRKFNNTVFSGVLPIVRYI